MLPSTHSSPPWKFVSDFLITQSITIANSNGDKMHPCRTPVTTSNQSLHSLCSVCAESVYYLFQKQISQHICKCWYLFNVYDVNFYVLCVFDNKQPVKTQFITVAGQYSSVKTLKHFFIFGRRAFLVAGARTWHDLGLYWSMLPQHHLFSPSEND